MIEKQAVGIGRIAAPLRTAIVQREFALLGVLVIFGIIMTAASPVFLTRGNIEAILLGLSVEGTIAVGMVMVMIIGGFDLSVGSTLGLTAYLTGKLFIEVPGLPIPLVFLAGIVFGGLLGLVNGILVAFGRVPALVITLGTLMIYRGVFLEWAGSDRINPSDLPSGFLSLGTDQLLTIPLLTIVALLVVAAVGYYLHTARGGRELYAIGSDPDAATLFGLPVTRRVLAAFVVCGALAGLAGVFYAARYGSISSNAGRNIELEAVAAAVIGGVAIFGGSGTVWGAAAGAFLLVTIDRALPVLGIPDFWQRAVVGALIIGAVVLDRVLKKRQERRLIEARDQS
jgi:rhamnose transport system permease protein